MTCPSQTASSSTSASAASSTAQPFATPCRGASLPITFTPRALPCLVVGAGPLAAKRVFALLEADADVTVVSALGIGHAEVAGEVRYRAEAGEIAYVQTSLSTQTEWEAFVHAGRYHLVCVTDTLSGSGPVSTRRPIASSQQIAAACRSLRTPLNVADHPALSTFLLPSTHRFAGAAGPGTSGLQVAVSTGGNGCRLATRIKREVVGRLPREVGEAVDNLGRLRAGARAGAKRQGEGVEGSAVEESARKGSLDVDAGLVTGLDTDAEAEAEAEDDGDAESTKPLNTPVRQLNTPPLSRAGSSYRLSTPEAAAEVHTDDEESTREQQLRRMRWVAQISEYYPFSTLASLSTTDFERILSAAPDVADRLPLPHHDPSLASSSLVSRRQGRIYLIGSGPGHPGLLTIAAHRLLTSADVVLSDKLVPAEILTLIPPTVQLHIARKFPGNAEGAQNEMMLLALEGAREGKVVVRLKQGDPYVFGRGGEEVLYFRQHGFECTVVPGVSSALAGPAMFNVPVTQRGVAESMVLCTGVGRQGRAVQLPGYVKGRTVVLLMGVARIGAIVRCLTARRAGEPGSGPNGMEADEEAGAKDAEGRDGPAYPPWTPVAVIERASSPDQRIISSTLAQIGAAVKSVEERPPGMIVVGWSVLALEGAGRVDVLDQGEEAETEQETVRGWLDGKGWKIREGRSEEWDGLMSGLQGEGGRV